MDTFLFTSESVTEGHPDKLCDQISDAVLDACLEQDPDSKVACEACVKKNMVMIFGEITTKATVDYEKVVRDTCRNVGFVSHDVGLDADNCEVHVKIEQQSPDIAQAVHGNFTKKPIGAGDQGHMFGYATDETPELMPLSHVLATKLGARLTEVRKDGTCPWMRPDGQTQVTVEYYNDHGVVIPVRVHTVSISTQHDEMVTDDKIAADLKEHVIKPAIPDKYLDEKTIFHLNPSGRFVIGGPRRKAGLTGRQIIADTYGGWGSHGGGAFSGKDASKVDRSGAYAARQAAKSVVGCGLAKRCIVQVSYAIGLFRPLSVFLDTYGTGKIPDNELLRLVTQNCTLEPGRITNFLKLQNGRFLKTAVNGHFGRDDPDFTWEVVKTLRGAGGRLPLQVSDPESDSDSDTSGEYVYDTDGERYEVYSDGSHDMTRKDREAYGKQVRQTDGYDVQCFTFGEAYGIIQPIDVGDRYLPEVNRYATLALEKYNEDEGTSLQFKEVKKVMLQVIKGFTYYITFDVLDPDDENRDKVFQARVNALFRGKYVIEEVRPKPTDQSQSLNKTIERAT